MISLFVSSFASEFFERELYDLFGIFFCGLSVILRVIVD